MRASPEDTEYLFGTNVRGGASVHLRLIVPVAPGQEVSMQFFGHLLGMRLDLLLLALLFAARTSGRTLSAIRPILSERYTVSPTGDIERKQLEPPSAPISVPPITRT